MIGVLIPALVAIFVSVGAIYITKMKEREAIWRAKKLAYYEAFFVAMSGIAEHEPPSKAQIRFANAVNNLHLVASPGVIRELHLFCDHIKVTNPNRSQERHDTLWSRLVWEIRADLDASPSKRREDFGRFYGIQGLGRIASDRNV